MGHRCWIFGLFILAMVSFAPSGGAEGNGCSSGDPVKMIPCLSDMIDHGLEKNSCPSCVYVLRGGGYLIKGEYDRAIKDFNKSITLDPTDTFAYDQRGQSYFKKGEYDRAIKDFNKSIALDQKNELAYLRRGMTYFKKGDRFRAFKDYDLLVARNPNEAGNYEARGWLHFEAGEYDLAIKDLDKAIALKPDFWGAYDERGDVYEKLGNKKRAEVDFRKSLLIEPRGKHAIAALKSLKATHTEKAAEPDPTGGGFKLFTNTDLSGTLVEKVNANSADACKTQCTNNSDCEAFTFNVWNSVCFLKRDVTASLLEPSSISGFPNNASAPPKSNAAKMMARYRGKAFPGKPYNSVTERNSEYCEDTCKTDRKCVAWSFVDEGSQCKLFSTVGEYSNAEGIDSGVKRQVAN